MRQQTQSGVAAVELALVIIPMLMLCLGISELGRALFQYNGLIKAGRGAVRYLTQQDLNDDASYSAAVAIAASLAVCGKVPVALDATYQPCADSEPRLVPGLDRESQVSVTRRPNVPTGAGTISLVTVQIGGTGGSAVKFISMVPIQGWEFGDFLMNFSFAPVAITMAYSAT